MRSSLACAALLAVSCVGSEDGPASPRPESVEPSRSSSWSSTPITIRGEGFLARPTEQQSGGGAEVDSRHRAWLGDVELGEVTWVDTGTLRARVPAGLAVGWKRLVVENAFGLRGALDDAFEVTASPTGALEVALVVAPATLNVGQAASVTFTVRNGGSAALREVVPEALASAGEAAAGASIVGPSPASAARLEPGASAIFSWSFTAAAPGALSLTASARALDDPSSVELSSPAVEASATVQMPAALTAVVAAGRATANVGQAVPVTLTLTNGGAARADLTTVTAETAGPAASCDAVTPAVPQSVEAGASLELTWSCTASAAGTLSLGAAVVGVDGTSGADLSVAPPSPVPVAIQTPAALSATLAVAGNPTEVPVGAPLVVTATVVNAGEAGASVTRVEPVVTPPAAATCGAPSPSPPQPIAGLATTSFTWSCTALLAQSFTLGASVGGADANTGEALETAPAALPLRAEIPAMLIATIAANRSAANVGQAVTATFTLNNGGTATANITEVRPEVTGTATATCGPPSPATASIAGRRSRTFTWTCTASAPGTMVMSGTAIGTDGASGAPLSVAPEVPASVIVQIPAALVATLQPGLDVAVTGQPVGVTLVLENTGEAAADVGRIDPTPDAICTSAVPGPPQRIAGGTSLELSWECTAASAGSYTLGATVSATDVNTNQALAVLVVPVPLSVQAPAELTVESFTFTAGRATANVGQAVEVTLRIANGGGTAATVTAVTPSIAPPAAPGCTATAPAPSQTLAAGGDLTFTWTCAASATGSYTLGAEIQAVDAVTSAPLSASAGPLSLEVQTSAALTASIQVVPGSPLVVGQLVTVTLTVTNTGGADASVSAVTPSPAGVCSAPTPALPRTVGGGLGATFGWTCTPTAVGSLVLGASVGGTDLSSGASLLASADPVTRTVVSGTALSITSFTPDRTTLSTGQPVAVTLVVLNGGQNAGTVESIVPSMTGGTATCNPTSLPARDVPAGGSVTFEWTCTAAVAGSYFLGATIEATDAAGQPVPLAPTQIPVTVQTAAALSASLTLGAPSVPASTPVGVTLQLQNTGQAMARVTRVTGTIDHGATCLAPSAQIPQDVDGGATVTFSWTCTATEVRSHEVGAEVAAADVNTGGDLTVMVPTVSLEVTEPAAPAGSEPAGEEVVLLAVDPLGDGTAEPLLGAADGAVWVGPGEDGVTLAFLDPAGLEAPVLDVVEPLVDASLLAVAGADAGALVVGTASVTEEAPSVETAAAALTTLFEVEGIVYAADALGIARSATAPDGATASIDVTPAHPAWWARASVAVEPATASAPWPARDRAVPAIVAFGRCGEGPCLLAARNVVGVPGEEPPIAAQLWRCAPSGGPVACGPEDWSLAAPDPAGPLTRLGEPTSEALTVLAATPRWLYVGLDGPAGVRLFRAAAAPLAAADLLGRAGCAAGSPGCEGLGGDGLGDPRVTRFIDAKVLEVGGVTSLWIVAGDGVGPARVYRVDD